MEFPSYGFKGFLMIKYFLYCESKDRGKEEGLISTIFGKKE